METSSSRKHPAWLKSNLPDLILILIILGAGLFVALKNYTSGTWLLGWDDLAPELNFKLNIARSLTAVWQEYQGLGLLGGMAHSADLPRQVILLIASIFVPASFLRYLWTFLMLILGPIGIYLIVSKGLVTKGPGFASRAAGMAAAAFYLFNLATVQVFYTPFETFVGFYGLVPWLLYFALCYLQNGKRPDIIKYAIVSILGMGAFYVQTLFVVYAIFLVIFAVEAIIKQGKKGLSRSFKLGLLTLLINAFWLLPVIYFSLTSAGVPAASHINSIATPETQLMNQAKADFSDIATLKGYWFDYFDWNKTGTTYDYLYKTWISYSYQPIVEKVSLALFVLSGLGLLLSLFKKKTSFGASFLILLGISYFMLDGGTIAWIPFFSDIFRNAFTKWSNPAALIYSVGLGFFVFFIAGIFKNKIKYFLGILISVLVIAAAVFSVKPILGGNLINGSMRVDLPSYYLDTINYFNSQDPTDRIADFPLTDFWGWKFTDWGYRGSWFLWYGIPQPVLDRTFDVWSHYNENFYSEISHAVEAGDKQELIYVLNKYQVGYILFDNSVIQPGDVNSPARLQAEKDLLNSTPFISKVKELGEIDIYKVNLYQSANSFVEAPKYDYSSQYISTGQVGNVVINETFPAGQGYQTAKNCDIDERGQVEKLKIDGGDYYEADNDGVSCDYFYYPTLDPSQAYSMRITGKNISGRSLKFYLYNVVTKNVDLQELLPTGDFDKSYLILPTESTPSNNLGYTLSVETRSFGDIKSENVITGITFSPVAYTRVNGPEPVSNNLIIDNVQKFGTWLYKVDIQNQGLIQLGQGYDTGWIAFPAEDFPFTIFHLPFLTHVKADSWSNGWIVPSNIESPVSSIYIVFWPQILEFFGLGTLGVTVLILAIVSLKKAK
jgi:hypothetical protein